MFGKKKTGEENAAKPKDTNKAAEAPKVAEAKPSTPLTPRREQELKREAYQKAKEEKRRKMLEEQRIKKEKEQAKLKELKKRNAISMVTFCIGLVVMVTALICIFPTTEIIVFSTLLMFTFFFLGIAYQRLVMQLLVLALTCMLITGAFYMIMLNT